MFKLSYAEAIKDPLDWIMMTNQIQGMYNEQQDKKMQQAKERHS